MVTNRVRLALGELETRVNEVLWDHGGWLTPGEVHELLVATGHAVGYTTVMTVLARLWHKGQLERQKVGRAFAYHPLQTREERAASHMEAMLSAVRDKPMTLSHFVETLQPEERVQLRRLLAAREQR